MTSIEMCAVGVSALLNEGMGAAKATDPACTGRLKLAPISAKDVDDLALLHSDPLVAFWTGPWSRATIKAWAEGMTVRWADDGVGKWLARNRSDEMLVGRGGFTRIELNGEAASELGWAVWDALTGRGYASEIGRAALQWAAVFIPHLPVVAFTEVHNTASKALMRQLGMRNAGVIHRDGLVEGRSGFHPDAPFASTDTTTANHLAVARKRILCRATHPRMCARGVCRGGRLGRRGRFEVTRDGIAATGMVAPATGERTAVGVELQGGGTVNVQSDGMVEPEKAPIGRAQSKRSALHPGKGVSKAAERQERRTDDATIEEVVASHRLDDQPAAGRHGLRQNATADAFVDHLATGSIHLPVHGRLRNRE
jgi:RimJ/RimL family protein N-acetyltransferase